MAEETGSPVLKEGVRTVRKKGLIYTEDSKGRPKTYRPWLADCFSFLYDPIMKGSVFPKKLGADITIHYDILKSQTRQIRGGSVLELAAGSGSAVNFLPSDNAYTGTDISPGLLRRAVKNFEAAGFEEMEFYVTGAEELPFSGGIFSACLCILSLNFFTDISKVLREARRVMTPGGVFICSVPVPERNSRRSTIHGNLYSEEELAEICRRQGFTFQSIPEENGALLYFNAVSA